MKGLPLDTTSKKAFFSLSGIIFLALIYLFTRHWGDFVQYCLSLQITLHRYLVLYLLQQRNHQMSGGVMLTLSSFAYGFLHSVGPGHGKFIMTTYLATHREKLRTSRLITLTGSLMQGIVAILFVVLLAVSLNLSMSDLSRSRYWVEKASALLIAGFGLALICRAMGMNLQTLLLRRRTHPAGQSACGCGHKHQPAVDEEISGWRNALWVTAAIGIRPCSGALMILVFANAIGMFSWGMIAVMTMSLGTALSTMTLATLVHHFREWVITSNDHWITRYAAPLARLMLLAGGLLLILFALVLFSSVIPISTNGDFITAGC